MPITKKTLLPKNLKDYPVYIIDRSIDSDYFNITRLPPIFTGGRNSFLINGTEFLQNNSQILVEITDQLGDTIFQTMVPDYIEGNSRMISVEIYDTTATGYATITILGKADSTTDDEEIPDEWKDKYNVKWTKRILVDYYLKNTSPLKFLNSPVVSVQEKRYLNINSGSYDTTSIPFTASLYPLYISPRQRGYCLHAEVPTFKPDYVGGTVTGSLRIGSYEPVNINLPITGIKNNRLVFSKTGLISSSINNGIIKKLSPFRSGSYNASFDGITYPVTTSALLQYSTISTSSTNIPISYANIRIFNMDTVSGEIYKVRVYNKVATNYSDYKLIADTLITNNEILVSSSIRGTTPIGDIFLTPNFADNWYSGQLTKNTSKRTAIFTVSGSGRYYNSSVGSDTLILSSSDDIIFSSIYSNVPIDLATNKFSGQVSESGYFIGTKSPVTMSNASEYTLTLDAYYSQTSGSVTLVGNTSKVDIYLVGSGSTRIISNNPLGQQIGSIEINKDPQWFVKKQFNFFPAISTIGTVGLRFVISNGFWSFSNISIKPASDPQFSPDEIEILIPNTEYHNELLQYKIEFFGLNNNSADLSAVSTPVFFTGSAIDLGTLS